MTVGVFGVAHSGTSAVSGVIRILGVPMFGSNLRSDDAEFANNVELLSRERNSKYKIWGFKHPSLIMRMRELESKLRNPKFILVFRDPVAIGKHNSIEVKWIFELYRNISMNVNCPLLLISYEKLLIKTTDTIQEIAEFLDLPFNQKAVKFIDPKKKYQDIRLWL